LDAAMNFSQKIVIALVDIALIVELCVSMYFANQNPDRFTPLFMKYFFSMLIPTLVLAKVGVNRLRFKKLEWEV
jgi:hypothetical protein